LLILSRIDGSKQVTAMLDSLSKELNIPLSTLKLNAKVLKELGLISFSKGVPVEITPIGRFILEIIGGGIDENIQRSEG